MSEMPVVSQIQHYQKSIEKCADNESRVLHCIQKLYRLPVTVQHLQETGVGRTVNALRKYDGTVGDAAKALVAKWKTMVVDEESSECDDEDETCIPDVPEGYSDNSDSGMDKGTTNHQGSSRHRSHESHERNSQNSSRHDSSRHNSKQSSSTHSHSKSSIMQAVPESSTDQSKNSKSSSDKSELKHNHDAKHDSRGEKKSKSSRDSKSDKHSSKKHEHHNSMNKTNKIDGLKGESSNKVSSTTGVSKEVNGNDAHRKRKREVSTSNKHTHKRRRSATIDNSDNDADDHHDDHDVHDNDNVDDDDDDDDDEDDDDDDDDGHDNNDENKFLPDTSVQSDIECDARIKIKTEPSDSPMINNRASTSKDTTKREKSSKDKHGDSSNKLKVDKHKHSSDKHKSKSESKSEHRRSEKRKDETRNSTKSSTNSNSRSSKDHNDSSEKIKERKSSESKNKNTTEEHKDKKKKKSKYNGHDGIDCNSGTSFAEALGMCMAPVGNKKKMPSSPGLPVTKNIKVEPGTSSLLSSSSSSTLLSPTKAIKVKTETSPTKDDQPLSLLAPNVKLEPLSVDLASTLPEISPHYKPLPTNYMNPIHRRQEEDKALNEAIYAKNMRTKVYSGNKTSYTSVPSLYELCIRVLIENIEALEATGGVPYYIIKPVLERATADQLFMIEHYNPYLIEDTDEMWKFHCNREFRTKEREEMESWREMYMRCLDEREAKLKTLTANIKQSIDKSLPARSTKMAYVDNIVKPPRNVLRKQAKYGTSNTATSSSDLKKKILTGGNNAPTNIAVPPPPGPRIKSSSSGVMKKNKAPLMAKALQLIKGRYKR